MFSKSPVLVARFFDAPRARANASSRDKGLRAFLIAILPRANKRTDARAFVRTALCCARLLARSFAEAVLLNLYRDWPPKGFSFGRRILHTLRHKADFSTRMEREEHFEQLGLSVSSFARYFSKTRTNAARECSLLFISQSEMQRIIHITSATRWANERIKIYETITLDAGNSFA